MSEKKGRCVLCGGTFVNAKDHRERKTVDHVFPKSWFPDSTPANVQRWTVPVHFACNNKLSAIEKDIFIRLSFCTDPRKIEASGLSKKALAALGIGVSGLSPEEQRHRIALRTKLLKQINPSWQGEVLLPGLGPHEGFPRELQAAIELPAKSLYAIAEKIVRGCEYTMNEGRIVESPYELSTFFVEESEVPDVIKVIAPLGPVDLGPGFKIQRGAAIDDPSTVLYRISVWDTVKFFAAILPE